MTSRIVVNNIQADAGVSTVTFASNIQGNLIGNVTGNLSGSVNLTTGITTVAAGSTSAPSITPTGDNNTGIFFPSADTVCIGEGGSEIIRVNSSGNVGINSTSPQTKLDVVGGIKGVIVQGTSQVSTAGTSIDFTGIPSWAKRVTVMFNGVSTNGTSNPLIQIGAGSVTSSGYSASSMTAQSGGSGTGATYTSGFGIISGLAANIIYGTMTIINVSSNTWVSSHAFGVSSLLGPCGGGTVTLSGTLDRVRITTVNGTDTFDAGSINILYEG